MRSKSKKMEGQLMKLKERFIEKEDPSIFLREYLNDTKKILGEVEQAYRTGASDRNKIVPECQKKISEIVELSEETLDLLMKHQSGLLPPEDANQTVNEEPVNEAQGQFTRDMRLWGKGGYTYLSGELDKDQGKVHLPKGVNMFKSYIQKVRAGDIDHPVRLQVGQVVYPVDSVKKVQDDIIVHFDPTKAERPAVKSLDKKLYPRIVVR